MSWWHVPHREAELLISPWEREKNTLVDYGVWKVRQELWGVVQYGLKESGSGGIKASLYQKNYSFLMYVLL